jgi:hypothetical protein
LKRAVALCALALAASACSTEIREEVATGAPPLCANAPSLGTVAVVAETRWRPDQKEPAIREAMAARAIARAFAALPCGQVVAIAKIGPAPQPSAVAADTLVRVRIEELGPLVTLSLPVLWRIDSGAKLRLTATTAASAATLLDVAHHRTVGGPFSIRPASKVEGVLEDALRDLVYAR